MRTFIRPLFYGAIAPLSLWLASCSLVSSQEASSKPTVSAAVDDQTGKRLDAIEKALERLLKDIDSLKQSKTSSVGPTVPTKSSANPKAKESQPISVEIDNHWLKEIPWRSIGPANMGGRITDIVVHDKDPSLWWIATASGGLLKTKNQGVTVEHQFDRETTVSIGAVAVDPTNTDVLWVGTGESNPRNSVSYGDGVYKSTDGGKSWKNMGLKESFQISRILVDPKESNTVYVGVSGRLYGTNRERGVYKTTDGGKTWSQSLFVDDRTGVIDMVMHPEDPNIVIAAMWDRMRDGFDSWPGTEPKPEGVDGYDPIRKWGPGGGLYKTTDGGKSWKKLSQGLPTSPTGRIGIDWQSKSPHVLYAIIDCEEIGKGPKPFLPFLGLVGTNRDGKAKITQVFPDSPAAKAGAKVGDILERIGDQSVTDFDQLLEALRNKKIGESIELSLLRGEEKIKLEAKLTGRPGTGAPTTATVWLGLTGEDREQKVVATRITLGGPAEKGGLKAGDTLVQLNDQSIENYASLIDQIRTKPSGEKVKLKVKRGEESLELTITLELRPESTRPGTPAQSNVYMGISGENGAPTGAKLTSISEGGPSEKAGLKVNDVILKIQGDPIADYDALVEAIQSRKPDDKMKLSVLRGNTTLELEVTLGDRLSGSSGLRPYTYSYFGQSPNVQDQQGAQGHLYGGVYRSRDGGETWERVNSLNTRPMYFSVVKVDPSDENRVYVLGVSQFRSSNGGLTFTPDFGRNVHADGHDLWIDPKDGRHMIIGGDGGFYVTYDYGDHWDHINTSAVGQFYHVAISPKKPYWVFGGLQDNGSWGGPAISKTGGAINEDWISVSGGDGFVCRVDPNDPDLVYFETQNGNIGRRHLVTGERASIRPPRIEGVTHRFNWNTPFILSHHNSKIFYSAGNYVFRSLNRGDDLRVISPEITRTARGSATALCESPINPNVLYVGSDDGALWVTKDGGTSWQEITKNLGLPEARWISTIEASRFEEGRVYICIDAHRSNDDQPYIFVSEDFGTSFTPLHKQLPWGSTRCLREDIRNPNLLYLGTEFAFWISLDRGLHWTQCNQKLPTVAIHEVACHPENGEIVLATHGRSLWAADVSGLRQLKPEHLQGEIAFHQPTEVIRWRTEASRGRTNRRYAGENPASGAPLWYSLPKAAKQVAIQIENIEGQIVGQLPASAEKGLHRVQWNLIQNVVRAPASGRMGSANRGPSRNSGRTPSSSPESESKPTENQGESGADSQKAANPEAEGNRARTGEGSTANQREGTRLGPPSGSVAGSVRGGSAGPRPAQSGSYRVTLVVDGKNIQSHVLKVESDPTLATGSIADDLYESYLLQDEQAAKLKSDAKRDGKGVYQDH